MNHLRKAVNSLLITLFASTLCAGLAQAQNDDSNNATALLEHGSQSNVVDDAQHERIKKPFRPTAVTNVREKKSAQERRTAARVRRVKKYPKTAGEEESEHYDNWAKLHPVLNTVRDVLFLGGLATIFVGSIMLQYAEYNDPTRSRSWFRPFKFVTFTTRSWDRAKGPYIVMACGVVIAFLGYVSPGLMNYR